MSDINEVSNLMVEVNIAKEKLTKIQELLEEIFVKGEHFKFYSSRMLLPFNLALCTDMVNFSNEAVDRLKFRINMATKDQFKILPPPLQLRVFTLLHEYTLNITSFHNQIEAVKLTDPSDTDSSHSSD
jgi:hypothetical protein